MKTNIDIDLIASECNFQIDYRGGLVTKRNGLYEVWGNEMGADAECLGRAKTKAGAINGAVEYMQAHLPPPPVSVPYELFQEIGSCIRDLTSGLQQWVEIADEEDVRQSDWDALDNANDLFETLGKINKATKG